MRLGLFVCVLLLTLSFPVLASAEEPEQENDLSIEEGVELWLSDIDWSEWEEELDNLPNGVRELWNSTNIREAVQSIAQTGDLGLALLGGDATLDSISGLFLKELKSAAGFFSLLLGVSVLGGACMALSGDKQIQAVDISGMVCRSALLLIVLTAFSVLAYDTLQCIASLGSFMELATPVLMTLLAAVGGTASAGVFQPAMSLLCTTVTGVVERVIVPLALCGGVLGIVDRLSERMRISELSGFMQGLSKWTIGALTTVYIAVTSIRGMTAAAYDGVTVRAARYTAGSMVPMFGSLVSGSFDTMLGCAALVKNALGVTAILLSVSVVAVPMLRLLAYQWILRLSAAIAQPRAGAQHAAMMKAGAAMIGSLLSACTAVLLMFIVTLGLITGLGNAGYL